MQSLGKYIGLQEIGRGASAVVYQGMHQELKVPRALKVFREDSQLSQAGLREAILQAQVEHAGIVRVMDIERQDGHLFMVMEYSSLGALRKHLEKGPLPFLTSLNYAAQVASALDASHAQGVWHLDLKPENLLLFESGQIRIADFGLARSPQQVGDISRIMGTPQYMAPEQLRGQAASACDIWALGVILFEMLTGHALFRGKDLPELAQDIQAGPDDIAKRLQPAGMGVNPALVEILGGMLQGEASQRLSAQQAADSLSALAQGEAPPQAESTITQDVSNYCADCGQRVPLGRELCPPCAGNDKNEQAPSDVARPPRPKKAWTWLAPMAGMALALMLFAFWSLTTSSPLPAPNILSPSKTDVLATSEVPVFGQGNQKSSAETRIRSAPLIQVSSRPNAAAPRKAPVDQAPQIKKAKRRTQAAKQFQPKAKSSSRAPATIPRLKRVPKPVPVQKIAKSPVVQTAKPQKATATAPPIKTVKPAKAKIKQPAKPVSNKSLTETPSKAKAVKKPPAPKKGALQETLTQEARHQPQKTGSLRNLALLALQKGDYPAAEKNLRKLLSRNPRDQEARNTLDMVRALRGKP